MLITSCWFLIFQAFSPIIVRTHKGNSCFQIWFLWGLSSLCRFPGVIVCFSLLSVLVASSLPRWVCLARHCISALPTPFDVAFTLPLVVEFLVPVFKSSSGLFMLIWVLSNCICGTRGAYGPFTPQFFQSLCYYYFYI